MSINVRRKKTYTSILTASIRASVRFSKRTVDKKHTNVRQARTLKEYANIAFPLDNNVCIWKKVFCGALDFHLLYGLLHVCDACARRYRSIAANWRSPTHDSQSICGSRMETKYFIYKLSHQTQCSQYSRRFRDEHLPTRQCFSLHTNNRYTQNFRLPFRFCFLIVGV